MKKKLLIAMIPVLGMGALVGSGFSAWVFGNQASQTFDFNGTINVTPATGDLTLDYTENDFSVTLDQGGKGNVDNAVGVTVTNLDTIEFTLKTNDSTVITAGTHKAQVKLSFDLTDDTSSSVTNYLALTTEMTNLNVDSYADLTTTAGTLKSNINYTYSAGTWTFTITMPSDDKILNYSDNYVAETSGKPKTYADWNAMKTALNEKDLKITLKVDAQVIEAQ